MIIVDTFTVDSSSHYTSGHDNGGSNGTWTWDTGNSRIVATGGSEPSLSYTGQALIDMFTEIVSDQLSNGGGLSARRVDDNHMYAAYIYDNASSSTPNTFQIYKINNGYTLLASGSINFSRGTSHTFRLTVLGDVIVLSMDGIPIASAGDSSATGTAGTGAMIGKDVSNTQHFNKFTIADIAAAASTSLATPTDGYAIYDYTVKDMTAATYQPRLQQIAASGVFKLVMNYSILFGSTANMLAYINYAYSLGLRVIVSLKDIWISSNLSTDFPTMYTEAGSPGITAYNTFATYVINQVKSLPGVWGYYVDDEGGAGNHTALKAFSDAVKAADSTHPRLAIETVNFFGSAFYSQQSPSYDCADVAGDDYYPVGGTGQPTMPQVAYGVQTYATIKGIQPAIVLQGHSIDGITWPSIADMQSMLYTTLQYMKPRIVLWYSYQNIIGSNNPSLYWNNLLTAIKAVQPTPPAMVIGNGRNVRIR